MGTLSVLLVLPLLGVLIIGLCPPKWQRYVREGALVLSSIQLLLLVGAILPETYTGFANINETYTWVRFDAGNFGTINIDFALTVDGISYLMLLLVVLIFPVAIMVSDKDLKRQRLYYSLLLLLNFSLVGCFLASDLFLFYLFFEFMLLPMFVLIGIWGGVRREYAALKFFLYTLLGSLLLLPVLLVLHAGCVNVEATASALDIDADAVISLIAEGKLKSTQVIHSFSFVDLYNPRTYLKDSLLFESDVRLWAFLAAFIAFAVKLPVVPVHTWLPDAHVEASTPVSILLAAVLLKAGGYGLLRVCLGFFPDIMAQTATWLAAIGATSIIIGALNALAQHDLKALIAYSSISHMGFVVLGLASGTSAGMNGAILQMFNHGIVSAMLFMVVGVLYNRVHDRQIAHFQGLWVKMPQYAFFTLLAFFAGMGFPGFGSFVAELLVLIGAFESTAIPLWLIALAIGGIVLAGGYFLWAFRRMFFGKPYYNGNPDQLSLLHDITTQEKAILFLLAIGAIIPGIFPQLLLNSTDSSVSEFLLLIEDSRKLLQK